MSVRYATLSYDKIDRFIVVLILKVIKKNDFYFYHSSTRHVNLNNKKLKNICQVVCTKQKNP